ncbi:MAG: hypothetical protein LBG90_00515 [Spirochaetaceae bacterium]|jgi:hypothetical protein|nr:hypothetical protein [Spirochaetaceae bacterium]
MNNEKIVNILAINHDGTIIKIVPENYNLNIQVEIQYLANMINEKYTIMNYKLLEYSKFVFIDIYKNNKIYTDIDEIAKTELSIGYTRYENNNIIIDVFSSDCPYGQIHLMANDIIIYDQNDIEIDYEQMIKMSEEYWNNFSKNNIK